MVYKLRMPAAVLVAFLLMWVAARGATPQPAASMAPAESGCVQQPPAQVWQFLLDTPHRAKGSVWTQFGFTALFFIIVTVILWLGGGAFGARRVVPALLFGVFFSGAIMMAIVIYGGIAPFVVIPWGMFMFVRGFKGGRRSPEKWFYEIAQSGSAPAVPAKRGSWFPPVSARDLGRPSVIALVVSNLVPVLGVLALGWQAFPILMLYWMENVVIGFYNVLRMIGCTGEGNVQPASAKWYLIPFFCGHYGLFCAVHGFVLYTLFGGASFADPDVVSSAPLWPTLVRHQLGWALLGLTISHGVSFVDNYLRHGERRRAQFGVLMIQPYARVAVLHLALLLGAGAGLLLGQPTSALVLLVLMKIALDLRAHLAERLKLGSSGKGTEP